MNTSSESMVSILTKTIWRRQRWSYWFAVLTALSQLRSAELFSRCTSATKSCSKCSTLRRSLRKLASSRSDWTNSLQRTEPKRRNLRTRLTKRAKSHTSACMPADFSFRQRLSCKTRSTWRKECRASAISALPLSSQRSQSASSSFSTAWTYSANCAQMCRSVVTLTRTSSRRPFQSSTLKENSSNHQKMTKSERIWEGWPHWKTEHIVQTIEKIVM